MVTVIVLNGPLNAFHGGGVFIYLPLGNGGYLSGVVCFSHSNQI
jgi:hypothetical protein